MPWSLPLSENYRSLIQTTQALSAVRSQDQEPQRPSVERSPDHPLTYQGQVAGAGTGTEQDPKRHSIVDITHMPSQQDLTDLTPGFQSPRLLCSHGTLQV